METEATTATVASAGKGAGNRPLEGMVALVSGGSRGLGRLLSARLAVAGAAIALIARSPGELAAAVGEINRAGGVAAAVSADVTDRRATAAAVAELRERLGTVDILVNNAGISGPIGPAWQARPAEWWQAIEVNLGGAFVLTQLALAHMIPAGRGRIINITSYAGVYRWPLMSAYAASKAALVKLTSKGQVFYRQERMGLDGKSFAIVKFRSMFDDAERHTGPVWAVAGDPRVTPLGRFMRRSNIDELPQLWNVLMGEMSIVGPRPERPHFVEQFRHKIPQYMLRHKVKAGLTGWAQVNGWRGNTPLEKRIEYDLYYIENWSVRLDLKIMWLTLVRGFFHKHAY